jgi:hypothetical protein
MTSLSIFKSYLSITDDTQDELLQVVLDSAISWVATYTGRNWSGQSIEIVNEQYQLTIGSPTIVLRQMDIQNISTINADGAELNPTDYSFTSDGIITLQGGFTRHSTITITYTYGALLVPPEITIITLQLATVIWNERLRTIGTQGYVVKSERIGDYQVMHEVPDGIPRTNIQNQLSAYRKRRV